MDFLPAGTATGNADAVRTAPIAAFFYGLSDVLAGVDAQPRMEPGNTNSSGLVGPQSTFGVDVGIDADGKLYMRGRAAPTSTGTTTAAAAPPNRVSPLLLIGLGVAAYLILKRAR